jgi:hypothetical protein
MFQWGGHWTNNSTRPMLIVMRGSYMVYERLGVRPNYPKMHLEIRRRSLRFLSLAGMLESWQVKHAHILMAIYKTDRLNSSVLSAPWSMTGSAWRDSFRLVWALGYPNVLVEGIFETRHLVEWQMIFNLHSFMHFVLDRIRRRPCHVCLSVRCQVE